VNFGFSDEQEELRATVRRFLADRSPESQVRQLMETDEGYDPAVWRQLADQLGLQGLAIPEQYGGSGFGVLESTVVFEEMGRALLCAPYFSTVALAVPALLTSGDEAACSAYLPGIAAGETIATVAVTEADGRWAAASVTTEATRDGEHWRLDGTKDFVLDGHVATLVLVLARTDSGLGMFAVDGDAGGLTRTLRPTLDQTRKLARLELAGVTGQLVGSAESGWSIAEDVLDLALVSLAAEQVGGAQHCLEMAVEYAKQRVQFGRPIGSFQAVKHKCADLLVEIESAKSAAYYAAWCASERNKELPAMASMAKAYCSEAFTRAAADNIQIHGGIGFTWEHPAHLYLKRAKSSELLFGSPVAHRSRLGDLLGI
jgi:alkylation response protein AidB-like acyl-CoA dehydrogenase